ncbi:MAG: hypothetical protein JST42_28955 [Bacteroidetes bacterium]|nr:hypothetical protein [Bacteroidota bacterium]
MSKLFLTLFASFLVFQVFAQDSTGVSRMRSQDKRNAKRQRINNMLKMEEEGDLIFNKHNIFGIRLATDGYGINFEKGKFRTPSRTFIYSFELNEKHDPKEHHISATSDGINVSTVVPFKINNLYEFKVAVGQQHLIGGKGNKNGVAVTALYQGGLTLGLLKPYYLDVQNRVTGQTQRKTFEELATDTLSDDQITGASGFTVGWGNLKYKPAVNAKQALRFDYGRLNQTITAIEVGLTEEFYFSKIPLAYLIPQKSFFFNAYVQIMFGSRK